MVDLFAGKTFYKHKIKELETKNEWLRRKCLKYIKEILKRRQK